MSRRPSEFAPMVHRDALRVDSTIELDHGHVRALQARGIKVKEAFTIVDDDGEFFRASLKAMNKRAGRAEVYEQMSSGTESPTSITLLCAVLARQRMTTVMQKATELGVARIIPVLSEHSVPREGLAHQKAHAWPKQVQRAARQCRRASLPEVRDAIELDEALQDPSFQYADLQVYLDDRAGSGSHAEMASVGSIAFAVGPEGGWSDAERERLASRGAVALKLGGRVLRAETAVFAGLTVLQYMYGDMGSRG